MARGVEVGHSPVHIVLDGDPAPFPQKGGRAPQFSAHFYSVRNAHIASAVLATAIPSVRLSVRPSVRLSVCHTPIMCQNDGT